MPKCLTCSNVGRKVKTVTLESLLMPQRHDEIRDVQYYVCTSPDCETVYYDQAGTSSFVKSDLTVRFGLKETEAPRPVCYCFNHTVEEIEEEIRRTGQSTVVESIKADIKNRGCSCEHTNPLGACCLKTVQAVVDEGYRLVGRKEAAVAVGTVDHADCCAGDEPIPKENAMSDCCSGSQGNMNEPKASTADCCQTGEASAPESSHGDRAGAMAAGGSIFAAVLSSACCWLPLLLIAFGASAAGVAGFFEAYRPYFLTLAVCLLGLGYYRTYFRRATCAPGSACASTRRKIGFFSQAMLWTTTALVGAFVFFPQYVGYVVGATPPSADAATGDLETSVYHIEGMTCQGCADILNGKLAKLPNVKGVEVDYDSASATVRFKPDGSVAPEQVIAAVEAAGFSATLSQNTNQEARSERERHPKTPE